MWACWGAPADPWVQYSWDIPVELTSMDIMYFDNRASDPTYNGQSLEEWGGIAIPISQELYYLDESGEWVEITADMMAEGGLATELVVLNTSSSVARPLHSPLPRQLLNCKCTAMVWQLVLWSGLSIPIAKKNPLLTVQS